MVATIMQVKHPCSKGGCPALVPKGTRHCPAHTRAVDKARGTRQQRGYDADHDAERQRWEPLVQAGTVSCARCGERIRPVDPWQLGHTTDRRSWTGPEHQLCNLSAAGRAAHGLPAKRGRISPSA